MSSAIDVYAVAIDGIWTNESGSELELFENDCHLTGSYRTQIGAAKIGKNYALTGWRYGRCLGFSVAWGPDSDSVTSWSALIDSSPEGEPVIAAVWLLVSARTLKEDAGEIVSVESRPWEAFKTQSVSFRRNHAVSKAYYIG